MPNVVHNLAEAFKKAMPSWDPGKHPRDRTGQFIEVGDWVKAYSGPDATEPEHVGMVKASYFAPDGRLFIGIEVGDGTGVHWYRPKQLEGIHKKATLDKPELPIPAVDSKDFKVEWDQTDVIPTVTDLTYADGVLDGKNTAIKLKNLDQEFKNEIGLSSPADIPKTATEPQADYVHIPADKTPEDLLRLIITSFENKYDIGSVVYPGGGGVAAFKADFEDMLADPDHESAAKKLSKLMTAAKLGGKQRKRYNSILSQKHGGKNAMKVVDAPAAEPAPAEDFGDLPDAPDAAPDPDGVAKILKALYLGDQSGGLTLGDVQGWLADGVITEPQAKANVGSALEMWAEKDAHKDAYLQELKKDPEDSGVADYLKIIANTPADTPHPLKLVAAKGAQEALAEWEASKPPTPDAPNPAEAAPPYDESKVVDSYVKHYAQMVDEGQLGQVLEIAGGNGWGPSQTESAKKALLEAWGETGGVMVTDSDLDKLGLLPDEPAPAGPPFDESKVTPDLYNYYQELALDGQLDVVKEIATWDPSSHSPDQIESAKKVVSEWNQQVDDTPAEPAGPSQADIDEANKVLDLLATTIANKGLDYDHISGFGTAGVAFQSMMQESSYQKAAITLNKLMTHAKLGGKQRKRYKDALAKKFGVDTGASAPSKPGPAGGSGPKADAWQGITPSHGGTNTPAGVTGPTIGNKLVNPVGISGGTSSGQAKARIQKQLADRLKKKGITRKHLTNAILSSSFDWNLDSKQLANHVKGNQKMPAGYTLQKSSHGMWSIGPKGGPYGPTEQIEAPTAEDFDRALRETVANSLVQQWAQTSNDSNPRALALQLAAEEEFGLSNTYPWATHAAAAKQELENHRELLRTFLRAMYENTQEWAKANNVKTVRLRRGSGTYAGAVGSTVNVQLRPMSSFSTNLATAESFGAHRIEAYVPIEWVIGTAATGFGCQGEYEWVVLGGVHTMKVIG